MSLAIARTVIVPLGPLGYRMAQQLGLALRRHHPDQELPGVAYLPLLEESAAEAASRTPLPALGLEVQPFAGLAATMETLGLEREVGDDAPLELLATLMTRPRQRAQVSLGQNAATIVSRLAALRRQLLGQLRPAGSPHEATGNGQRLSVFVLLSLADSFMTGLLPDLPYLIRHALTLGVADDQGLQIHLVLAMPGFKGEVDLGLDETRLGQLTPAEAEHAAATHRYVHALAAACLHEIDYYWGHPPLTPPYRRRLSDTILLEANSSPLGEGRIVLLEPVNERSVQLDDVDVLASMVGDWLYHMICTEVSDLLSPGSAGDMRPYCSIGHGSLVTPMELWVHHTALRLQSDLLQRLGAEQPPWTAAMEAYQTQLGLTAAGLERQLTANLTPDLSLSNRSRHTAWGVSNRYADSLQQAYTSKLDALLDWRGRLRRRERELTGRHVPDNLGQALRVATDHMLDEPATGIATTAHFLDGLRTRLTAAAEETQAQRAKLEKSVIGEAANKEHARARHELQARAQTAAPRRAPFLWLTLMLAPPMLLALGAGWWLWHDQRGVVLVALSALALGAALILGHEYNKLRFARLAATNAYQHRLQALGRYETLQVAETLYADLLPMVASLRDDVNLLRGLLNTTARQVGQRLQTLDLNQLGSGYSHGVSRSLLTPAIIEEFDRHSPLKRTDEQLTLLYRALGTPRHWLKRWGGEGGAPSDGVGPTFAGALGAFAMDQAREALRGVHLTDVLQLTERQEAARLFHELLNSAMPYAQVQASTRSQLGPPRFVVAAPAGFNLTRYFGAPDINGRPIAVGDAEEATSDPLREETQVEVLATDDAHQLIFSSVRHGLRLPALPSYSGVLAADYDHLQSLHASMHTLPDRALLPDPRIPLSVDLPPARFLYILGRGLNVLRLDRTDNSLILRDKQLVGRDPGQAMQRLANDPDLARTLARSIAEAQAYLSAPAASVVREWASEPGMSSEAWARNAVEEALAWLAWHEA